ncbi:hypothetical protein M0638_00940 [Roseomonas sp. NAR14]|uniref:Uncharacterized protein n=1 Tax=Roseomonas acroporae TaxID=2937791 RepID=A0A9X1Y3M1_9PROT|nr:hypothetical protein [Roseomonas acroporae]MCK8782946.1 hypothetical protein [Roseomonas acroporae]
MTARMPLPSPADGNPMAFADVVDRPDPRQARRGEAGEGGGGFAFFHLMLTAEPGAHVCIVQVRRLAGATTPRFIVEALRHAGGEITLLAQAPFAIAEGCAALVSLTLLVTVERRTLLELRGWSDANPDLFDLAGALVLRAPSDLSATEARPADEPVLFRRHNPACGVDTLLLAGLPATPAVTLGTDAGDGFEPVVTVLGNAEGWPLAWPDGTGAILELPASALRDGASWRDDAADARVRPLPAREVARALPAAGTVPRPPVIASQPARIAALFGVRRNGETDLLLGDALARAFPDLPAEAGRVGRLRTVLASGTVPSADWRSAVMVVEAGPGAGAVLLEFCGVRRHAVLDQPQRRYLAIRFDDAAVAAGVPAEAPLEVLVPALANGDSAGSELVLSGWFDHYPRHLQPASALRFAPGSRHKAGSDDMIVLESGGVLVPEAARAALVIRGHDWSGLVFLRRGDLVNAADLYRAAPQQGLILGASCDVVFEADTVTPDTLPRLLRTFENVFA